MPYLGDADTLIRHRRQLNFDRVAVQTRVVVPEQLGGALRGSEWSDEVKQIGGSG